MAKPETFSVASLNLNGIRPAERRGFSDWLARTRPDHLLLQELRAHPEQVPDEVRSPVGYNCRWECALKKGYAGTAIYTRSMPDTWTTGLGLDWADTEGRVVRADLPELSMVSLYLPSGSSSEERQERKFAFMDHAMSWLAGLLDEGRPMIVAGDLNLTPWSPFFREFVDRSGLRDSRRGFGVQATWPSRLGMAGIPMDHVLVSQDGSVIDRRVGPSFGSDHRPVIVDLAIESQ